MGAAHVIIYLNPNSIYYFFQSPHNKKLNFPSDPAPLVDWLQKKQWGKLEQLHKNLWQKVDLEEKLIV